MTGMTPLVSEPAILRVVRLIKRVKEGPETSDGGLLRKVLCGHIGGRYFAELWYFAGVGFKSRRLTNSS
jgi:hypothetical protein